MSPRQIRIAHHAAEIAASTPEETSSPAPQIETPTTPQRPQRRRRLPSGFKEAVKLGDALIITPEIFPWLDKPIQVPLTKVTLAETDGKEFYLGSAIRDKDGLLKDAADHLRRIERNQATDRLFYTSLPEFVKSSHHPGIRPIDHPRTRETIYTIASEGDQRVYISPGLTI